MKNDIDPEKTALIEEIQRRIFHLLSSSDYTAEERAVIARRFFQALDKED